MRILIIGINGQVGWDAFHKLSQTKHTILGFNRKSLDLSNLESIPETIESAHPQLVVNCAAYTAVDNAEKETQTAYTINTQAPALIARQCASLAIPFIHFSTDYVFNGEKKSPYTEDDPVSPLGIYGKSKESGEQEVRSKCRRHIILRTSWVYGTHGHNFVKTMLKLGRERDVLKVVDDQWGCPTYAGDIANALSTVIEVISKDSFDSWGTYHCCGSTPLTWYNFATQIFAIAAEKYPVVVKDILPITTDQFPTPAKRPAYSVLDCQKFYSTFGVTFPEVSESLQSFFTHFKLRGENR